MAELNLFQKIKAWFKPSKKEKSEIVDFHKKDEEKIIESDYLKSKSGRKNNRKSTNGRHTQKITVNGKTKFIKHKI